MPRLTATFNRAANSPPRDMDLFLMKALIHKDTNVAIDMIDNGADVNYRNKLGETPLMAAALNGNAMIVEMLLEQGADVNAADAQGNTPLHWLARADWTREIPGIAQAMIDGVADPTLMNARGETPGYVAGMLNKSRLARVLGAGIPGVPEREETIEIRKPLRLKTAPAPEAEPEPEPEPAPEVVPEPVAAAPAPPPARVEKSETISEMEKRFAKAGLFG